ncbi:hypothetical protein ACIBQ6_47015 [Nonomuraea sp. NPDC049655]|uniref:hypothetical protein n=1 Tax=Nonomuraea sp. NPDC049655 TaxID=3364355 RepID=UPI0037A101F8
MPHLSPRKIARRPGGLDLDLDHPRLVRRAADVTDRPGTGRPRVSIGATERLGARTSRADLAAFLVGHLDDPRTYRLPVAVSS